MMTKNKQLDVSSMDASDFIGNIDPNVKDAMLPAPPKPGEQMICKSCGRVMTDASFSRNLLARRREQKWQLCKDCIASVENAIDMSVPGLASERTKR